MEDESHMTEKIWNLTMEIICLLAGEALPLMKFGSHEAITVPPPPSLTPERHTMQKILEVANKITELLTAEVALENSPIKKVKEEAVENAGTRDIEAATNYYIKVTVEDQPLVPAPPSSDNVTKKMCPTNAWFLPDGSSTTNIPERSHQLVYSQDSKQEVTPHHYQAETVKVELAVEKSDHTEDCKDPHRDIKVEFSSLHVTPERSPLGDDGHGASAEDTGVKIEWLGEDECGETSPEIDAAGQYTRSRTVPHPSFSAVGKTEEDDIQTGTATGSFITTDDPRHANPSSSKGGLSDHTAQKIEVTSNRRSSKTAIQYSCFKCGKCFIQGAHLINHERVHTGAKPYSCSECGKSFSQYSHGMNHERVHTGEKPYSCSECGKCFSQKAHLINHERIHTGEKPYSCSECGKSFSDRSACVRHERVHTGEKPFSCSECGKSFSDRSSFNMHERLHTGEKPYSCSECGKRYVQKSELLRHERIHTGEKPYSCSVCGKCFSHRSNWTRHEKAHAGEKPYSCSVCGKCFTSNAYRKRHESGHTGV